MTTQLHQLRIAYIKVQSQHAPQGLRWDTLPRDQGQIIEVQYGAHPSENSVAGPGAQWKRIVDHSTGQTEYWRLST